MKWFRRLSKDSTDAGALKLSKADRERQSLNKIKDMCSITNKSAENAGLNPHGDESKADRQRFDSAKRLSIQLLKEIQDVSYRDDALVHIVELCMKAGDLETAITLIRSIQTPTIRQRLANEYPVDFY